MVGSRVWLALPFFLGLLAAPSPAQTTELYTVSSGGAQATGGGSGANSASVISADGRYIVFGSGATNLVAGDTNGVSDLFVRDRVAGTTRRVNVSTSGVQADQHPQRAEITANGRYAVFSTNATTLVPGDTGTLDADVFLHDLDTSVTTCISADSSGVPAGGANPSISADGRFVAFESRTNFWAGDTNGRNDIYVRDRQTGSLRFVSTAPGWVPGNDDSQYPSISANGRYVAFLSEADNLVAGDTNPNEDVFVRDLQNEVTERVNVTHTGAQGNNYLDFTDGPSTPVVSADGRFVAFFSNGNNLVVGDTNGVQDVFVRDRVAGTTERVNVGSAGQQGSGQFEEFWMSANGRWVAFSDQGSLVPGDTNAKTDVFVRDRLLGTTERASIPAGGGEGNEGSFGPAISADGRFVMFGSNATNFVPGDVNGQFDGFLRDRGTQGFTTLCEPGSGGVIGCPCSNPPSGPGRGCNNHGASTGGAALSGSGTASLFSDGVTLSVAGENSSSLTIFWTGSIHLPPPGVAHGAGVRCVVGLHRLYSAGAMAGFVSRPVMGDPSVSARSAAVGAPITAGQVRYYFTIYRDPLAVTPCGNTASGINLSNTVSVQWAP